MKRKSIDRIGLTLEQIEALAKQLGRPELVDEHPDKRPKPKLATDVPDDGMNKTERAYSVRLEHARNAGQILRWWREPFAMRLAGKTSYRIDFMAETHAGVILCLEVKGFMRDDASVKIKVAAERFPCFFFYLVYKERGSWVYRPVTRTGIGQWCPEPF